MKVIIVGANGKIGRILAQKMSVSKDYHPIAFIRKEEQKGYFEDLGIETIVESLESSEDAIANAIKGVDAIVFTAGSGGKTGADKTIEIDLYGAIKVINAAKKQAIHRFVMVSAAFSDRPEHWSPANMKPYYIAKHLADETLKVSGLNYTIIRPVLLTDDENIGRLKLTTNPDSLEKKVPRAAVANVIIKVLPEVATYGNVLEMSEGNFNLSEALEVFYKEVRESH